MRQQLDDRGRIVIPKELRDRLAVGPGDEVSVFWKDGRVVISSSRDRVAALQRLIGIINDSNIDPSAEPIDPLDLKKIWEPRF